MNTGIGIMLGQQQARKTAESLKTSDFIWPFVCQHFPGQEKGSATDLVGTSLTIPRLTHDPYEREAARIEVVYTSAIESSASRWRAKKQQLQQRLPPSTSP